MYRRWISGQIVVDVDGVNITELINKVAENGYSLRVVEESDQQSTCTLPPFATFAGCIRCSTAHITEKDNAWLYPLSHQTSDVGESEWIHFTGSGYLNVPMRGHIRFCGLNDLECCQKRSVVWLSHLPDVMASISLIWMPALNACRFTHFQLVTRNNMKSLTTETALDILIAWLQDNKTAIRNYL